MAPAQEASVKELGRFKIMKNVLFLVTFAIALQTFSNLAQAQMSGLPFMGAPCDVKPPETMGDIDAGYVADETCENIYVFPPLQGSLAISPPFKRDTKNICAAIASGKAAIPLLSKNATPEQVDAYFRKTQKIQHDLDAIGDGKSFSDFGFSAYLRWNDLLAAYKEANRPEVIGRKVNVMRLPLVAGVLDARTIGINGKTKKDGALTGLEVYGLKEKVETDDGITDDFIKKVMGNLDTTDMVLFNGSVGGHMSLNLETTCSLFDKNGNLVPKTKDDPRSAFSGTYSYFYPIQTKASYGIELHKAELEASIMALLRANNGSITDEQIIQSFKNTPDIVVTLRDGIDLSASNSAFLTAYKSQLKELTARAIVGVIADRIAMSIEESTQTQMAPHVVEERHTSWVFFTSIERHVYYVPIKVINWAEVENKLGSILNTSPGASEYKTLYLYGTTAFSNLVKQQ